MAEILTDKNSLPKSPTQLEKIGLSFSSLFSLARACVFGDIAPLNYNEKFRPFGLLKKKTLKDAGHFRWSAV